MSWQRCRARVLVALACVVLGLSLAGNWDARAATRTWFGTVDDSWHVAGNWQDGSGLPGVPVAGDVVSIKTGPTVRISGAATAGFIKTGDDADGGIIHDSGTLTTTSTGLYVGYGNGPGTGTYVLNDLSSDSVINTNTLVVGQSEGNNTFTQNGGTVNAGRFFIAVGGGNRGLYEMFDGALNIGGATGFELADHGSGADATAVFTQHGGTVTSDNTLNLGANAGTGGSAIYNFHGGTLTLDNTTPFGFNSSASNVYFDFDGATWDAAVLNAKGTWDFAGLTGISNADFRLHGTPAAYGDLDFTPGTGALTGFTVITEAAPTVRYWEGGISDSWHEHGNWVGGVRPRAPDDVTINNGLTARITEDVTVNWIRPGSDSGDGSVVQDGGTTTVGKYIHVGFNGICTGTYTVNDGSTLNVGSYIMVGQSTGNSSFIQNDGTVNTPGLYMGYGNNANSSYEMDGGVLNITGSRFRVANHGTGTDVTAVFTQTGGEVVSNAVLQMGSQAGTSGAAIYNLLGGTLTIEQANPIEFNSTGDNVYFDFGYGGSDYAALVLPGTWDYGSLTSIVNADFRLYGVPATDGMLVFEAGTGGLAGYTIVYGVPEPSTLLLATLGLAALLGCARRRRKTR